MNQYGKKAPKVGRPPSVCLINPKFKHNVGATVRAASCFGIEQVWFTGNRVSLDTEKKERLPREERMKGYKSVDLIQFDYPFDAFDNGVVPVAIEIRENSIPLPYFTHPENALYIFGPEDGSLGKAVTRHCHSFAIIPSRHCTNLAAAVYIVLYDRMMKSGQHFELKEERGFIE
jgi:tRNA(Leu) C34 or U34 (ribose-2'-O)-methylase TrmL